MLTLLLVLCLRLVSGPIHELGVEGQMRAAGRSEVPRTVSRIGTQPLQLVQYTSKVASEELEPTEVLPLRSAGFSPEGEK